ncbi:MAG: rubrerythrin family protein [Thermoplasmata archaeon]|nr:rubrerythrin family protein [Thermoplasmata archaeon]
MKKMVEKALQEAFAGESMAHMKYLIYASIAEKEGYKNVARLFKAIAYAEKVHATNHAKVLGMAKDTKENLIDAINGELFEVEEMYPVYGEIAKMQNEGNAIKAFHYAMEAEKIHATMYEDAKKSIENNKDIDIGMIYICPICGHTHIGFIEECPICGYKGEFEKF